jgi:hypothetical protein
MPQIIYHRGAKDYLYLAAIFILLASFFLASLSSSAEDSSTLMSLISGTDDPHITVTDLAFFLATHNFDATPKGDYVEVHIGNTTYRLVPNGSHPGLADVTVV